MSKLKTKNKYEGCPEELAERLKAGESIKGRYSNDKRECFLVDYNSLGDVNPYRVYYVEGRCYYWCNDFTPEYEEEVDWSKAPIDTLVEVSDDGVTWYKRYFKKYYTGTDCPYEVFAGGSTSKTTKYEVYYKLCRIVEENETP